MIDIKKLKQLVQLMSDNDLSELDLRDNEEQVTLKRSSGQVMPTVQTTAPPPPAAAPAPAAAQPETGEEPSAASLGLLEIKSPMVGTFYSAPSPDADVLVRVGSHVDDDSVVCILEAMKVFNEIKAEVSGTVQKVLVANGDAVEFGQPLFQVKPD
ncbi:MAG: acetyl-CoA carboxylase biotin carboxyl carrier protein [Phycisphaeraceae bacterium]